MSGHKTGRLSFLLYCLLAVMLLGGYVLFNGLQVDNSATMPPNLTLSQ